MERFAPRRTRLRFANISVGGALIPGANIISTYDHDSLEEIIKAIFEHKAGLKKCPKGPYAACMTAPCKLNNNGTANCKCPVF